MTVSLLTPLQTVFLRASTDAALRWASEPEFFPICLPLCSFPPFHAFFSDLFLRFPTVPSRNVLIFPTVSSSFLGFSKLAIHFLLHCHCFSTCSSIFLHSQLFATSSSTSPPIHLQTVWLRTPTDAAIELQTVLLRTPTDAALRWASDPWFFEYACLYVPSFFKALPCLHYCMTFFQIFSCVHTVFPEVPSCNFLIFATVSSSSLVFPSLPFICSSGLMCFFTIFLHFPPFSHCFYRFSNPYINHVKLVKRPVVLIDHMIGQETSVRMTATIPTIPTIPEIADADSAN